VAAAVAGYALLSHLLMLHAADRPWAVAALFGPLVLGVSGIALQRRHLPSMLGCAALVLLLAAVVVRGGVADVSRLYVLQHAAIHAVLAWSFAITLRPNATARVTQFAEFVHKQLTPAMRAYTRRLTGWWAAYFVAMTAASPTLFALAPWAWWSFFANVLTPLFAITFFFVEHALRYRLHPEFERVGLKAGLHAYRASR